MISKVLKFNLFNLHLWAENSINRANFSFLANMSAFKQHGILACFLGDESVCVVCMPQRVPCQTHTHTPHRINVFKRSSNYRLFIKRLANTRNCILDSTAAACELCLLLLCCCCCCCHHCMCAMSMPCVNVLLIPRSHTRSLAFSVVLCLYWRTVFLFCFAMYLSSFRFCMVVWCANTPHSHTQPHKCTNLL